ncbi:hypothetical protein J6590_087017 [Homalodisca vitripennis]|nr:hypothetical protein J6590_087017 [Homalodisca vitripennis]
MKFIFSKESRGKVVAKSFIGGLIESKFSFGKTRHVSEPPTTRAYLNGKIPIKNGKIVDMKKLKPYLTGYEEFYDEIYQWPTLAHDNDSNIASDASSC